MKRVFLAILLAFSATSAQAVTVVNFLSEDGATLAPANVLGGVTASDITRGAGLAAASGDTFNSRSFTVDADRAAATAAGDFLAFNFTSTNPLDLFDLGISYDRSPTGPQQLVLELNANGGGFVDIFTDTAVSATSETNLGIDLSSFTNITSAEFRLVGFGATGTLGTFDLENAAALGGFALAVTAVPVPAALPFLLFGFAALFAVGRRRNT